MTIGGRSITSFSTKQKLNTRSSTEAELVTVDDAMSQLLWSRSFLQHQGIDDIQVILYQDNKSAMILQQNGRMSTGKCSRHLNVRYFFVTDVIKKGLLKVMYCPTGDMIADFFTKPIQGRDFKKFCNLVQNYR